jgi:hypothetical protein
MINRKLKPVRQSEVHGRERSIRKNDRASYGAFIIPDHY